MTDFTHKIALITGAGGVTGRQLALDLAAHGAVVVAVDLNPLGLDETAAQIHAAGGRITTFVADAAKRLPIVALVDEVLDAFGRIDVLVCAAQVRPLDPILSMDEWDFHRTLDVNLAGPFFLVQRVGQAMIAQGGGVIVLVAPVETQNIASPRHDGDPADGGAAYRASMAALAALIQSARDEFASYNIRVVNFIDFGKMIATR